MGWHHGACVQRVNGDWSMLSWLMTFHAARLGLEAQNAMAFRFFRLVGDTFGLVPDSKKIDSVDGFASPRGGSASPDKGCVKWWQKACFREQGPQKASTRE